MSPKFERADTRRRTQERDKIHEARWQTRGDRSTTEKDIETDISMSEIYRDKPKFEQYKKVGFHQYGTAFLRMIEKWEKDEDLGTNDTERNEARDMRDDVRSEFVTRMGIVKSCEALLTKDVLKGVGDAYSGVNRLVGELGEEWALSLIKPRMLNLVGEEDGTESLTELWSALRDMHGVYKTRGFNAVYSRIEKYRAQYGISPAQWAEITRGNGWNETQDRAYEEFQKQHHWFGRAWHGLTEDWHASRVAFAAWRERSNSQMVRLRETRTRALDILSRVLGEDFLKTIDKAIKTGNKAETEQKIKAQEERDAEHASGLSADNIQVAHDHEWDEYTVANPAANTSTGYDNWRENVFKTGYERQVTTGGMSWISRMLTALFNIRLERIPRPAGI